MSRFGGRGLRLTVQSGCLSRYLEPLNFKLSPCANLSGIQLPQVDKEKVIREWKTNADVSKLNKEQKKIHERHLKAVDDQKEAYVDPYTGFEVFSMLAHLNRGYCCGNACRHCPYKHLMVEQKYKNTKIFNGSFYS